LVDSDDIPPIELGFHDREGPGILVWERVLRFEQTFDDPGYEEVAEHRDEAKAFTVKIGMAVAMADGVLDDSEGETLKGFIQKAIAPYDKEKSDRLKTLYNDAMKDAHAAAKSGDLSLSSLTSALNEIADKSTKYETVELCFEVMAADGVADAEELRVIRTVADALDLDLDEIEKMRDQKIVGLETNIGSQASIEDMLGIEADWDAGKIKKHLLSEFQKWNNRLNALSEGDERDNAQQMLDLIAEARKKHG